MNLKEIYKKYKGKYIGNIQYIVTIIANDLTIQKHRFDTIKQADEFINKINGEPNWMVKKIGKIRIFDFQYKKNIIHTPFHFQYNSEMEIYNIKNRDYKFLIKDKSLTNISRNIK